MRRKWTLMSLSLIATTAIGGLGMTHADAATVNFSKSDAQFCEARLNNVLLSQAKGSSGNCVRVLQDLLNKAGASPQLQVDGSFGPKTTLAVKAREKKLGWNEDGIVSAPTFGNLASLKTTPSGPVHISGVVTNAQAKPAKTVNNLKPVSEVRAGLGGAPEAKTGIGSAPPVKTGLGSAPSVRTGLGNRP